MHDTVLFGICCSVFILGYDTDISLLNFRELKFSVSFCILTEGGRKGSGRIAVPIALHRDGCWICQLCVHRGVLLPAANLFAGSEA